MSLNEIKRAFLVGLTVLVLSGLAATGASAQASNIYITPDGGGSGVCTNNVHPLSWLDNGGNWGNGAAQIGSGTTVHLCGTFTSGFTARGSGAPGNPITFLWETGAKFSAPVWKGVWIILDYQHDIVLDGGGAGGTNGIIENTANGSPSGVESDAIRGLGMGNVEVKNLLIRNMYQHTSVNDNSSTDRNHVCMYINFPQANSTISIHHNVMHDVNWCIDISQFTNPGVTVNVYNNEIYNADHGMALEGDQQQPSYTVNFHDNWLHDFANWDSTWNSYHHDGIHIYTGDGIRNFWNNKFSGDCGHNCNTWVYEEGMQGGPHDGNFPGGSQTWFNNVWLGNNRVIGNAFAFITGEATFYNNTFVCADTNPSDNFEAFFYNHGTGYYNPIKHNLTFENNVVTGCVSFLWTDLAMLDAFDYNAYSAAIAGGNNAWTWNGSGTNSFSTWRVITSKESHSSYSATSGLDANGIPQAGSSAIGAGANLSGLGIAALNRDKNGVPRPGSGPWSAGAFASSSSASNQAPNPPSGLRIVVQ